MQDLVDDHRVRALGLERERIHVALAKLGRVEPGLGELGAGEAEHFRAAVDAERLVGGGARTIRSSGRCRCRCRPGGRSRPSPSARAMAASTSLSATWSERKRVPVAGVACEIAGRRRRRGRRAPRSAGRRRRRSRGRRRRARPSGRRSWNKRLGARARAEAQEHPAALLAALGEAGVDQDADVARDPRLALPEHLRELADAQVPWRAAASGSEAGSDPPAPRRSWGAWAMIADIKISLYAGQVQRRQDCGLRARTGPTSAAFGATNARASRRPASTLNSSQPHR